MARHNEAEPSAAFLSLLLCDNVPGTPADDRRKRVSLVDDPAAALLPAQKLPQTSEAEIYKHQMYRAEVQQMSFQAYLPGSKSYAHLPGNKSTGLTAQ